jgi:hypothetical protein
MNMQQLEYWEGRPEYATLEEIAAEQGITDAKALPGEGGSK